MATQATPHPRADRRTRGRRSRAPRGDDGSRFAGGVAASAGQHLRALLRSRSGAIDAPSRPAVGPGLYGLPGRPVLHALVHFTAGRIHAAPDLQRVEQVQAGVPARSPTAARRAHRTQSGTAGRSPSNGNADAMTAELVIDVHDLSKRYGL